MPSTCFPCLQLEQWRLSLGYAVIASSDFCPVRWNLPLFSSLIWPAISRRPFMDLPLLKFLLVKIVPCHCCLLRGWDWVSVKCQETNQKKRPLAGSLSWALSTNNPYIENTMCVFLWQISIRKALVRQKRTKGTLAKHGTVFPDGGSKHILSGQACSRENPDKKRNCLYSKGRINPVIKSGQWPGVSEC